MTRKAMKCLDWTDELDTQASRTTRFGRCVCRAGLSSPVPRSRPLLIQYRQLVRSAPSGADASMRARILGTYMVL